MAITRGKIQRGDLANWDGKTPTASRPDASGGTVTGLAIGNEVDVLQVFGSGSSRTRGTIASAVQHIGSTTVTLVFAPGTWSIDDDLTIPATMVCKISSGCIFNVASTKTLTFSGHVDVDYGLTWNNGSGTVVREQTLTGAGAVNLTSDVTYLVTTGTDALTLADGYEGQEKLIIMQTDGGDGTLTPSNLAAGATIVFNTAGQAADLIFRNGNWHLLGGTTGLDTSLSAVTLASTANGDGASMVGIEDPGSLITATTVETALAELIALINLNTTAHGVTKYKDNAKSISSNAAPVDDDDLFGWAVVTNKRYAVEGLLLVTQNGGDFRLQWGTDGTFADIEMSYFAMDSTGATESEHNALASTANDMVGLTDAADGSIAIKGFFQNGGQAAVVDFMWAQDVSNANASVLQEGSWIRITQLD